MSAKEYILRQIRAMRIIARLRHCAAEKVARSWKTEGFAAKWAKNHEEEVK